MGHKPNGPYEAFVKRPLDLFLSLSAFIVLSPVMGVTAILVKTKLGSPVLFKQRRPGKDEIVFEIYKFRTMTDERDAEGNLLSDNERLTDFGKILRSSSLDELPELINIIKGDMSIVGPRPLLEKYLERYSDEQKRRHDVRPGLTGNAQAHGRNALSWEEKFELDLEYVDHITFVQDFKIVWDTVLAVIHKEGITAENDVSMPEFLGKENKE